MNIQNYKDYIIPFSHLHSIFKHLNVSYLINLRLNKQTSLSEAITSLRDHVKTYKS